ncbi:hypothetical protein HPB47_002726, partial [Ixodes persulcatus]
SPALYHCLQRNLGDIIASSRLTSPKSNGSGPCKKSGFKVCPDMVPSNKATGLKSNFVHDINGTFNCDSRNVVYLKPLHVSKLA